MGISSTFELVIKSGTLVCEHNEDSTALAVIQPWQKI